MMLSRLPGQLLLLALAVIPPAAVIVGSLVDLGPDGNPRVTVVHLGLAAADPIVHASVRASLGAAGLGTFLALALGTSIGHALGRWSFPGRAPLTLLVDSGLALSPLIAALGCRGFVDACARLAPNPTTRAVIGDWGATIAWILAVGLAGAPWVALAVRAALGHVPLSAIEANRQRGLSPRRAARRLVRPLIRPSAALAAAGVFARAIGDPGPPLILGLRRSLGFQIHDAIRIPGGLPRAATLGLLVLLVAVVGSVLIRWWGGIDWLAQETPQRPSESAPGLRWIRSGPRFVGLLVGALLILSPLAGLVLDALKVGDPPAFADPSHWADPGTIDLIGRVFAWSSFVGLGLIVLIVWSGVSSTTLAGIDPGSLARALIMIGPIPAVLGIVILQAEGPAWLLGLGWNWPSGAWIPLHLDPAIPVATLAVLLPMTILWSAAPPISRSDTSARRTRIEAARLSGLRSSQARRLARPITPRSVVVPGLLLTIAMAATTSSTLLIPSTPATLPSAITQAADRPPTPTSPFLPTAVLAIAVAGIVAATSSRPPRLGKLARQGFGPV